MFPLDNKKSAEINLISNKQFISYMYTFAVIVSETVYKLSTVNVPVKSHTYIIIGLRC